MTLSENESPNCFRRFLPTFLSLRISVEPAALFAMSSILLTHVVSDNLLYLNICLVARNNSRELCEDMIANPGLEEDEEMEIQKILSRNKTYRSIVDNVLPLFFLIFVGPISDFYGRKVPLLVTLLGFIIYPVTMIGLHSVVDSWNPILFITLGGSWGLLTGGPLALQMSAYSHICDHTDNKTKDVRTFRCGIMNAFYQAGVPIGFFIAGQAVGNGLGFVNAYLIAFGLASVAFLVILFMMKESGYPRKDRPTLCFLINPRNNFFEVCKLPFKTREGRGSLWLLFIAYLMAALPFHGEFGVMYLFLRGKVNWDLTQFSNFSIYNWGMVVLGSILSMGVLLKWLKLRDSVVGLLGGLSQFSGCLLYVLAQSDVMMYIASAADMMNGTMLVIARSMISKIVSHDEVGKLFSLMSTVESFVPLFGGPLYSNIYSETLTTFSGAFILFSAAVTVPPQLIFLWFACKRKQQTTAKT